MTLWVVDSSVAMKWYKPEGESHMTEARLAWDSYIAGTLTFAAPHLLLLELINSAARRWAWEPAAIRSLSEELERFRVQFAEPSISRVAGWALRGLTAYDACYVALAEELGTFVITADDLILRTAPARAKSLERATSELS